MGGSSRVGGVGRALLEIGLGSKLISIEGWLASRACSMSSNECPGMSRVGSDEDEGGPAHKWAGSLLARSWILGRSVSLVCSSSVGVDGGIVIGWCIGSVADIGAGLGRPAADRAGGGSEGAPGGWEAHTASLLGGGTERGVELEAGGCTSDGLVSELGSVGAPGSHEMRMPSPGSGQVKRDAGGKAPAKIANSEAISRALWNLSEGSRESALI